MTCTIWLKILWLLSSATIVGVVATVFWPKCIENGSNCWNTMTPCCRQQNLEHDQVLPHEFICWEFGGGICIAVDKIPNLESYMNLTQDISSTNYAERYHLYWKKVGQNRSDPWLKYRIRALQQDTEMKGNLKLSHEYKISTYYLLWISFTGVISAIIYIWCPSCFEMCRRCHTSKKTRTQSTGSMGDSSVGIPESCSEYETVV